MKNFSYRASAAFFAFALCVYLLPLGAFIKPSQEKTACDGKRPFHMCCLMSGKVDASRTAGPSKISLTASSETHDASKSSGAGGDEFLTGVRKNTLQEREAFLIAQTFFLHETLVPLSIEHPPQL